MAQTIYIGDDIATSKMEVLFDEQDFVNLVYEYMGRDARDYLELILRERDQMNLERDQVLRDGGYDGGYQDGFDAGLAAASEEYEES